MADASYAPCPLHVMLDAHPAGQTPGMTPRKGVSRRGAFQQVFIEIDPCLGQAACPIMLNVFRQSGRLA